MTYASSESCSVVMSKFIPAWLLERVSLSLRVRRGCLKLCERLLDGGGVRVVGGDLQEALVGGDRGRDVPGHLRGAGELELRVRLLRGPLRCGDDPLVGRLRLGERRDHLRVRRARVR